MDFGTGASVCEASTPPVCRFSISVGTFPMVSTGRCDVVIYDAPALGTLKARAPDRYGPFVGVIKPGSSMGLPCRRDLRS